MSIPEPTIDDRSYQQILDEALARIPVHNPEWTNYNESDPGVTMLQVVSFVVESMLYRANRVPERNRIKFLNLLGVDRQPATVAEGLVRFSRPRGPVDTDTLLPAETEVRAGSVPFRTTNAVTVLPVEGQVYYKQVRDLPEGSGAREYYEQLYQSYDSVAPNQFNYYETTRLPEPTPGAPLPEVDLNADTPSGDQSLWLALLARSPGEVAAVRGKLKGATLSLAIVPSLEDAERVLPPTGDTDTGRQGGLRFELPRADLDTARYRPVEASTESNLLVEPGVVQLSLPGSTDALRTWTNLDPLEAGTGDFPPALEETSVADRIVTWIRIQPEAAAGAAQSSLPARFSVVALNGARIEQRARVGAEFLGRGTGAPDQQVQLVNTPVLPDSLVLTVGGERWSPIDDLVAAPPEVPRGDPRRAPGAGGAPGGDPRVYVLDRATGVIRFGDGLRGARPPAEAVIQARYDYGGGGQGVVGIGAVQSGPALPSGVKVINPIPTWGGAPQESVAEAQRRIADYLKRRDRLVTAGDFAAITRRTPGVDIGRVEVLPLLYPQPALSDVRAEGVVTLLVIPASDPNRPDAPLPDRLFLDTICEYLDRRRLVTTEVYVRGPVYRDVYVSIGIDVLPGEDAPPVRDAVRRAIRTFLSPLRGGFDGRGWPLQRAVDRRELLTVAARVSGVASVKDALLADPSGTDVREASMDGVQLPRLAGLSVQSGPAQPLDDLYAQTGPDGGGGGDEGGPTDFFPVPVVPEDC